MLEDAARAVDHALVRARRRGLHPLERARETRHAVFVRVSGVPRGARGGGPTYHFYDIKRLTDQHLPERAAVSVRRPRAKGPCETPRTCAMPPAVPAVRSLTVLDMAGGLWGTRGATWRGESKSCEEKSRRVTADRLSSEAR